MPMKKLKKKFLEEYETLPTEAKLAFAENQLAELLEYVPKERATKVLSSVSRYQKRATGTRRLDLKRSRVELNALFDEIAKDTKTFYVKERSQRDEVLQEILHTMNTWLNDIWTVVYEHGSNFQEAHDCLLEIADIATRMVDLPMPTDQRCKCPIMTMPIYFEIRREADGSLVKKFALTGVLKLLKPILWVWRELFLSFFAVDSKNARVAGRKMLEEIEQQSNWAMVERILYGGSSRRDDEDVDIIASFLSIDGQGDPWADNDEDDDEDLWEDNDDDNISNPDIPYYMNSQHWSLRIKTHREDLWELVEDFLVKIFNARPSCPLFLRLTELSQDSDAMKDELLEILDEVYPYSSDNFVTALKIHVAEGHTDDIFTLLSCYPYLLRPRDDETYQRAVVALCSQPAYRDEAAEIIEKELDDTIDTIHAKIRYHFTGIEDPGQVKEVKSILKLRFGNHRRNRVENWVQDVRHISPNDENGGGGQQHPFVLAAMMMGLPPPDDILEELGAIDPLEMLDQDEHRAREHGIPVDPELEDLKEEFRPKLKERFQGWTRAASYLKGSTGQELLARVYQRLIEKMPWFKGADVVEEMISCMSQALSKAFVCDALDAVDVFCKQQRKRHNAAAKKQRVAEKEKKKEAQAQATAKPRLQQDSGLNAPPLEPLSAAHIPSSSNTPLFSVPVAPQDDQDNEDGPPPLERIPGISSTMTIAQPPMSITPQAASPPAMPTFTSPLLSLVGLDVVD